MKIGELAHVCGVPQATIRYYVKTGLLIPDDTGAQYNFTEREQRDLLMILKLKRQGFNLKEIHDYLVLSRHSNLIEPDTIDALRRLLKDKEAELIRQIGQLQQSLREIEQEVAALVPRSGGETSRTGVPVAALNMLVCPHCGKPLSMRELDDAVVTKTTSGILVLPADGHHARASSLPVRHMLNRAQSAAGVRDQAPQQAWQPSPLREERKAPSEKVAARVGVHRYYDYEITQLKTYEPQRVSIPLKMHIGAPAAPASTACSLPARCRRCRHPWTPS